MEASIDSAGRIVIPKPLRDALGLTPGTKVDISEYGEGLTLIPDGRTGRLVRKNGRLMVTGETRITDEDVFNLIDAGRR